MAFIGGADEGGGGNRISEEQIKNYLDSILGEAPRPDWGVPQGWGAYISGAQPPGLEQGERFRLSGGAAGRQKPSCFSSCWAFLCGQLMAARFVGAMTPNCRPFLELGRASVSDRTPREGGPLPKPCWTAA